MDEAKKDSILIVDDEKANILTLTHILSEEYTIYAARGGKQAIKAAGTYLPDIILLDIIMPEMDGYTVMAALKGEEKTQDIPIIFITGLSGADDEEMALALGAADYISKPFSPATVRLRVRNQIQILHQISTIERLTIIDQLTGICNRRGFDTQMDMEWNRATRGYSPLSVLMIDVDNFKEYNDTYGHQTGDEALREIGRVLTSTLGRPSDFVARWGGEEFIVLLPDTNQAGALTMAEKIRANIENAVVPGIGGAPTGITVSIGANTLIPIKGASLDDYIAQADKALYAAKGEGKNRVCQAG